MLFPRKERSSHERASSQWVWIRHTQQRHAQQYHTYRAAAALWAVRRHRRTCTMADTRHQHRPAGVLRRNERIAHALPAGPRCHPRRHSHSNRLLRCSRYLTQLRRVPQLHAHTQAAPPHPDSLWRWCPTAYRDPAPYSTAAADGNTNYHADPGDAYPHQHAMRLHIAHVFATSALPLACPSTPPC